MFHSQRTWSIHSVTDADWLAEQLSNYTFVSCQAFEIGSYLLANDSTCADGAQEYAILRATTEEMLIQIESITFSWCNHEKAREYIARIISGEFDSESYDRVMRSRFQSSSDHGHCFHCA
jgi:hypothetical protein